MLNHEGFFIAAPLYIISFLYLKINYLTNMKTSVLAYYKICLFILLVFHNIGFAQIRGIDLLGNKDHIEFRYDFEQGFMIVELQMQNIIPLRMIFDTGAENTILFDRELTDALGYNYEREIFISGSDLDTVLEASITRNVSLKLERCKPVKRDIIVIKNNNLMLRERLGIDVNGILGGSFFSNLIVKVDNRKRKIHFYRPSTFKEDLEEYDELDLIISSNKPYLISEVATASIRPIQLKLLLDTGAALPFLLHTNTDTSLVLPERTMLGTIGYGLSGPIRGVLGKSDFLKFGNYSYENIITSFQDIFFSNNGGRDLVRNGILGNLLLRRFTFYIDYTKEKLYIKGGKKYNKEFDYDKSGLSIMAFGPELKQFMISMVIQGSPGEEAGLMPGDVIIKVNGRRASGLSLQSITSLMSVKEGKRIKMVIRREGKTMKKQFELRDWYMPTGEFGI